MCRLRKGNLNYVSIREDTKKLFLVSVNLRYTLTGRQGRRHIGVNIELFLVFIDTCRRRSKILS